MMRCREIFACLCLVSTLGIVIAGGSAKIEPELLAVKDCPHHSGCPALILLDDIRFNNEYHRTRYTHRRVVKVFTEEGIDRYGTIELHAQIGSLEVRNLEGRTILPSGEEISLRQDNVHVKYLQRGKRRLKVKSATFPGVMPGAIIESSYDLVSPQKTIVTELTWEIQQELPVMHARFVLEPGDYELGWQKAGAEEVEVRHTSPRKKVHQFDAHNVPPLPREPFGPPVDALRARYYFGLPELQRSWLGVYAGRIAGYAGAFISDGEGVGDKVKELVSETDSALTKVRKIYEFVQTEIQTEEQRAARTDGETLEDADNAGGVLARGYGDEFERTLLFLALVREAGFDNGLLLIAGRQNTDLDEKVPDTDQFDSFAAAVKAGSQWTFYDPAARHCPFGMISPEKEGGASNAILITPQKGAGEVREGRVQNLTLSTNQPVPYAVAAIPFSKAYKNILKRSAKVTLDERGEAQVEMTEEGKGLVDLRFREIYEDLSEEERVTELKRRLADWLPGVEFLSATFEDIDSFDSVAKITSTLKAPGLATIAGDRMILAPSLFHAAQANPFTTETRNTPVHLPHAQRTQEKVVIDIPEGYTVAELPDPEIIKSPPYSLSMSFSRQSDDVVLIRRVDIDTARVEPEEYDQLKKFFEALQQADQKPLVLVKDPAS